MKQEDIKKLCYQAFIEAFKISDRNVQLREHFEEWWQSQPFNSRWRYAVQDTFAWKFRGGEGFVASSPCPHWDPSFYHDIEDLLEDGGGVIVETTPDNLPPGIEP